MSIFKLSSATTALLLTFQIIWGQTAPLQFEHLTSEHGLTQNDVNCILQDHQGFLWFGTHDGLNRYDGYKFEVFQSDPNDAESISSNLIFTLVEDHQQNLWVGTTGGGINHYNSETGEFTRLVHEPGNDKSLSNNYILSSWVDSKGRVWVGTVDGLNVHVPDSTGQTIGGFSHFFTNRVTYPDPNQRRINTIFESASGILWVGTPAGLSKLESDAAHTHQEFQFVQDIPNIQAINEDKPGNLIVGTKKELYYQQAGPESKKFTLIATVGVNTIVVEPNGDIWSGSNEGIDRFRKGPGKAIPELQEHYINEVANPNSLSKNIVKQLYLDDAGFIWIGTNGGGVNMFNPQKKSFRHYQRNVHSGSISYDKIRSIFEDSQKNLWVGTEGGGVNLLQAGKENYTDFQHITELKNIFAIAETNWDGKKTIWLGSEKEGLYQIRQRESCWVLEPELSTKVASDASVFSLLEDRSGALWVGTYNSGLYRFLPDGAVKNFRHNPANSSSLSDNIVRSILQDRSGNLWIGTGNGLNKLSADELNQDQPSFVSFKNIPGDISSLSFNYVLALHESQQGELWVGTFGGGLNRLNVSPDGTATFSVFKEKDGLPNNVIKSILEDESGNLWVATNKGLCRFDPVQLDFKNYDVSDGLQSNEFSELAAYKRQNGEFLFGGVKGFNVFYPNCISDNLHFPQVAITDFQVFNQSVPVNVEFNGRIVLPKVISLAEKVNLNYWENDFSLEFSALHFASPSKNQYAYMLEGYDEDWVYTNADKRFATYTNLKHGNYNFHIKAANNDGIWNEEPISLAISIAPPFWLSWWAYMLYGAAFLAAIWFIRKYTLIGIWEKHQLELEHLQKEKTEELHQMKLRFFTNISHEFRTPLTLILGPLEHLIQFGSKMEGEDRKGHYLLMQKNARYLLRLVNQLMDFRKIDQGKMKLKLQQEKVGGYMQEILEPFQFVAKKKSVHFEIINDEPELTAWIDKDKLEKILYNLVSNAFKFTPESGKVTASIAYQKPSERWEQGGVSLIIRDSGSGISSQQKSHIFERFYQAEGLESLRSEGSGIGLSFTKSLVELHQGGIDFSSVQGQGTCFTVTLPLSKSAYKPTDFVKEPVLDIDFKLPADAWLDLEELPIENNTSQSRNLPQLLIVDDHADIRAFVKQTFIEQYNVLEAVNGLEGLQFAERDQPDIIISDLMMPEMNGLDMCQQLKSNESTSHIPIILLTAKETEENKLEGLKTGADQYLTKPFNVEMLRVSVANLVIARAELKKRFTREVYLQPSDVTVTSADENFLKQAIALVEANMEDPEFNVEALVKGVGISRSKLHLKMKAVTGQSSSEFIRTIRLKRAVQLMEKSDLSVKEIMYQTGFSTPSYFSKCFKKQFGVIPSEYLKQERVEVG